jgi:hypothetical protein
MGTVQVSEDVLAKLLTSVEALQGEVSHLRFQSSVIQQKLDAFSPSSGCGTAFALFPKLSKEIRLMIWDVALFIPQVIGARYLSVDGHHKDPVLVPLGGHSLLRQVNREARAQAMRHQTRLAFGSRVKPPGIFANLQTDTIWVVTFDCDHDGIVWQPGKPLFPWSCKQKLPRLAFPVRAVLNLIWGPGSCNAEYVASLMMHLYDTGAQEVISVAGREEIATSDNIKLGRPKEFSRDSCKC